MLEPQASLPMPTIPTLPRRALSVLAAVLVVLACAAPARADTDHPPQPLDRWAGLTYAVRDRAAAEALWYVSVRERHEREAEAARRARAVPPRRASGSTAACIGRVENGGDYGRSSNPTHFGKYQYDRQTWVAHGGNAADWGSASPAEQERVFAEGSAKYGYGAWTRYDGC